MKLALLVLVAACRSETAATVELPPDPKPVAAPSLLDGVPEVIVGVVDDWDATAASLTRYRRNDRTWARVGRPWSAVVGKSGVAWGAGLHGDGAPAGRTGPIKREGDGKSPAGVFALGGSYGYAKTAPDGSKLAYAAVDPAWKCVDDPASKHYNRVLDSKTATIDWKSAEEMKRGDELYEFVVDVAHNASRVPNRGSCIFLHVWSGLGSSTVGCTAMEKSILEQLIATLDPKAVFVLLPRSELAALAEPWGLPRD